MARFPKPPEGSWTAHYPELGTAPISYAVFCLKKKNAIEPKTNFKCT